MLILVAVTVIYAINSGLLGKSKDSVSDFRYEEEEEKIGSARLSYSTDKETIDIGDDTLKDYIEEELSGEATVEWVDENIVVTYKETGNEHKILFKISKTKSYVGCYADVDGDGSPDGVIFVDLLRTTTEGIGANNNSEKISKTWNNDSDSKYNYTTITESKDYTVIGEYTDSHFGTHSVISTFEGTEGNDRFYVMALNDMDSTAYNWDENYSLKGYSVNNSETLTANNIANGRTNTEILINNLSEKTTLWNKIKDNYQDENGNLTWFVQSKAEWSAFGDFLYSKIEGTKCNTSNWNNTFGLQYCYWSSSQRGTDRAYRASFEKGWIGYLVLG